MLRCAEKILLRLRHDAHAGQLAPEATARHGHGQNGKRPGRARTALLQRGVLGAAGAQMTVAHVLGSAHIEPQWVCAARERAAPRSYMYITCVRF